MQQDVFLQERGFLKDKNGIIVDKNGIPLMEI